MFAYAITADSLSVAGGIPYGRFGASKLPSDYLEHRLSNKNCCEDSAFIAPHHTEERPSLLQFCHRKPRFSLQLFNLCHDLFLRHESLRHQRVRSPINRLVSDGFDGCGDGAN